LNDSLIFIIVALVVAAFTKPELYDKLARAWLQKREDKS
jgi:hypothetical protein